MNQHMIDTLQLLATMVHELRHEESAPENVFTNDYSCVIVVSRNEVLELIESLMRKELS